MLVDDEVNSNSAKAPNGHAPPLAASDSTPQPPPQERSAWRNDLFMIARNRNRKYTDEFVRESEIPWDIELQVKE